MLVSETDKGAEINTAQEEFKEERKWISYEAIL